MNKEILYALEIVALAFMVAIAFLTYPRQCEIKDSKGYIHTANCSEIYNKWH